MSPAGELKIRELSPELQELAIKNVNEVPSRRAADVQAIKDWVKQQPHIRPGAFDDQSIVSFLRGCKYSLERTKEKLDIYFTMRSALPEFFEDRDFVKNKKQNDILDLGHLFRLPEPDDLGRSVYIMRPGVNDPEKYSQVEIFKVIFMIMDWTIRNDDRGLICGTNYLMDMEALGLGHVVQMTPSFVKKVAICSQEGYPWRPQSQNFINTPSVFSTLFNLITTFSKEKFKRRMAVHGKDMESLYKNVPQRLLPQEYGGNAGPIKDLIDDFSKKLLDFNKWYQDDASSGVDEKKRPGKPKTSQELFGLEGSFRQLTVD